MGGFWRRTQTKLISKFNRHPRTYREDIRVSTSVIKVVELRKSRDPTKLVAEDVE
jgi:hypothetical protein